MRVIELHAEKNYNVYVGCSYAERLSELAVNRTRIAIIHSGAMQESIPEFDFGDSEVFYFPVPDGEEGKSVSTLEKLWSWLGAAGFTRSDLIVGLGGGAITDLSGFVAATWLRGIDWVAIPTTVAGAVDASVGGKTGVNSDYGKNLIGSFHSPTAVLIDYSWFATLSDRDFAAGLAEVIKCGFIADARILELVKGKSLSTVRNDPDLVDELVHRSISVKAGVVSEDFKESFAREALNYGHTFGHAIEKLSKYSLRHGECVSIGMAFIAELSTAVGHMKPEILELHYGLLNGIGLPTSVPAELSQYSWNDFFGVMKLDKKARGNAVRFVTLDGIGKTQRFEATNELELIAAYERLLP